MEKIAVEFVAAFIWFTIGLGCVFFFNLITRMIGRTITGYLFTYCVAILIFMTIGYWPYIIMGAFKGAEITTAMGVLEKE